MKHFSIDSTNIITIHASRKAAKETGNPTFSNEVQFADAIGPDNKRLLEIWNGLPGVKPVAKFANRKAATERIWKAIQGLAAPTVAPPDAAFRSCVEAVEAIAPETPFDHEPEPDQAACERPAAIGSAAVHMADQPTATPVATDGAQVAEVAPPTANAGKKATHAAKPAKAPKEAKPAKSEGIPAGTKTAEVVAMLKRTNGATLQEIMSKMGWQKHTVRGFMAGAMRKAGYAVESFKPEGGERTYRINP